jgi:hypothetical protein
METHLAIWTTAVAVAKRRTPGRTVMVRTGGIRDGPAFGRVLEMPGAHENLCSVSVGDRTEN